ncbi:hypothetical protein RJ640_008695 [Escallonia rubra]|uniref:Pentatricopeptide repeat-containing protein n=1 Tax=Escallonia rubra TaxID=112253 RepID=A0AA88RGX6_9ASTE|nr:hypothetical protein RJ640_008695 [Escallonia rubra]
MERAIEYLEIMVSRGCYPDIVTYNTLLTALCKDGKVDIAVEILNQLSSKGCSPVLITYNTVIDGLSKVGKTDCAIKLLDEMRGKNWRWVVSYQQWVATELRRRETHDLTSVMANVERLEDFKQGERPRSPRHEHAKYGGNGRSKSGSPKVTDDERSGDERRFRHNKEEKKHEGSRKRGDSCNIRLIWGLEEDASIVQMKLSNSKRCKYAS